MIKNFIPIILVFALVNFASAEIYITADEAIKYIFPSSQEYRTETRTFDSQEFKVSTVISEGKTLGWAVVSEEMGKNNPITFLVGIDSQKKVAGVYVLEFRDMFGFEIKRRSFLRQFQGKTSKNALKVGRDIDAVTGATISSKAAAAAVKKSIEVIESR